MNTAIDFELKKGVTCLAQVTYSYWPIVGGQEVYAENLSKIMQKRSHAVQIVQPVNRYANKSSFVPKNVLLLLRPPLIGRVIPKFGLYFFNIALFFKRRLLKNKHAVIVHYAFHSIPLIGLKNVIILSHGVEWHYNNMTLDDRIHAWVARYSFNKFTIVANDTHYLRHLGLNIKSASGYFSEVAPKKWFIPNCVDCNIFTRCQPLPELKDKKIIVVPRQITEDRGILLAISSFALFSKTNPDYLLYIIGSPLKGKYYEDCVQLVNKNNLSNKVSFLGFKNNADMPLYYSSAKMCLIPTLRREGTSLSALESMACGTPTISTNVCGLRDLPTVHADPNPEDICLKLNETMVRLETVAQEQCYKVRSIFNFTNWENAWLAVIESLKNN